LGKRSPSLESLSRIARFLEKDISYFVVDREESFSALIKTEGFDLKTKRLMKKFRKYCNDYVELENMTGRQSDLAPLYTNITAEKMAEQERRRLNLGNASIIDIFSLLEQNGLHVWRHPVPEEMKISGVFVFMESKQAAFALVNSNQSLGQQILTASHEYGHYLKDRFDDPVVDNPDIFIEDYITLYHGREKFAQTFALNFLLPPVKVKEIIERDIRSKRINFEDMIYLRRCFGVSFLAMLQTLRKLEYISPSKFKEFQKRDAEQFEEDLYGQSRESAFMVRRGRSQVSDRLLSLVLDAYRMKKISLDKSAKLLRVKKEKISSLS
ncbi:MAG: ImmA/IrrE family metallo-endopeptidase, partial [Candidatus Aminicenantes bacterium]|nr:ImmA/IrrE family metallo-endopeptidase [Candidatus Aminicenantes bacterium]